MKISDYIVEFLINKNVKDIFGYPGGMVTHFMDSLDKYSDKINVHLSYHEQGAAFAACGYAQVSNVPGVAFATSGPGATNLITGICNAYFDSIPSIFITGQVNTFESKGNSEMRQCGFQETDIVSMVKTVTKGAFYIDRPEDIEYYLEEAFSLSMSGRKGPVLLDIPMNIFRSDIDKINDMNSTNYINNNGNKTCEVNENTKRIEYLVDQINQSKRPCLVLGNGVKSDSEVELIERVVEHMKIPVVTSMLACDIINQSNNIISKYFYGFIGAYGSRPANFIVAKSDCVITIGSRLDVRQIGGKRDNFAVNSKIIRIDVDEFELEHYIRDDVVNINMKSVDILDGLLNANIRSDYTEWIDVCGKIHKTLQNIDDDIPNKFIQKLSEKIPENRIITTDVGQNQVWVAQSFITKKNQKILFSGGHGAMGYSLPAAIGAYFGSGKPVVSFSGDGGIQMNIQELQFIVRENVPIKIIIINNKSLGMIRHFQEMYFNSNFVQTVEDKGYSVPDFVKIGLAYGIKSRKICNIHEVEEIDFNDPSPELIEIEFDFNTYVFPKLEFGKPNQDQEPLLDRKLFDELMQL